MKLNTPKAIICAATALSCAIAFAPCAFASAQSNADATSQTPTATDDAQDSGDQESQPVAASYKTKVKKGFTFAVGKATYKVTKMGKNATRNVVGNIDGTSSTTYSYTGEVELIAYKGGKKASVPAQAKTQIKKTISGNAFKEKGTFKVTAIGKGAFNNSKGHKITSVCIGANVVSIGDKAFYKCKKLKKITLKGDAIRTIGPNSDAKLNRKSKSYVKKLYQLRSKKWKTCKVFAGVPRQCAIKLPNIDASKGLKYNIEYANAIRLLAGNASYVGVVK